MPKSAVVSRRSVGLLVALAAVVLLLTLAMFPRAADATTGTLTITTDTTLTEDHAGNVVIGADDVILDCDGHSLFGDGSGTGILINGRTGATVLSCDLSGFSIGIYLENVDSITLTDNVIELPGTDDTSGIRLLDANANTITDNSMTDGVFGIFLEGSSDNTIERNTATNFLNAGFLVTNSSQRNVLTANVARGSQAGFTIGDPPLTTAERSIENVLTDNEATGSTFYGFVVRSPSNVLQNNFVDGGSLGIHVAESSGSTLEQNTVVNMADAGILIESGVGNAMLGNVVHSNGRGIGLGECSRTNDPLDADAGANNCQNFPDLTRVVAARDTRIMGALNSTPGAEFRIDFFASSSTVAAGQGERFIGSTMVTTDAAGIAPIDVTLSETLSGATTITATATDLTTRDTSPFSDPVTASQEVALAAGWNLVGWAGATPVRDATASLGSSLLAAFTWDATGQAFQSFSPLAPDFVNTLSDLTLGDGVWVNTSEAVTWLQPPFAGARDVPLGVGFNLVMWTGPDATPVGEAVADFLAAVGAIFTWDAQAQRFRSFAPDAPSFVNSLSAFDHGDGVWIQLNRAVTWSQPSSGQAPSAEPPPAEPPPMSLTSSAFAANGTIPARYTCDGENVSPPLAISDLPAGTVTLAIIVDDPDAPGGTWVHWVEYDIPPATAFAEGAVAIGTQGRNTFGLLGYGGPCPPSGTHRYFFKLFALDVTLGLQPGATKAQLLAAMEGNILGQAELIGLFR